MADEENVTPNIWKVEPAARIEIQGLWNKFGDLERKTREQAEELVRLRTWQTNREDLLNRLADKVTILLLERDGRRLETKKTESDEKFPHDFLLDNVTFPGHRVTSKAQPATKVDSGFLNKLQDELAKAKSAASVVPGKIRIELTTPDKAAKHDLEQRLATVERTLFGDHLLHTAEPRPESSGRLECPTCAGKTRTEIDAHVACIRAHCVASLPALDLYESQLLNDLKKVSDGACVDESHEGNRRKNRESSPRDPQE